MQLKEDGGRERESRRILASHLLQATAIRLLTHLYLNDLIKSRKEITCFKLSFTMAAEFWRCFRGGKRSERRGSMSERRGRDARGEAQEMQGRRESLERSEAKGEFVNAGYLQGFDCSLYSLSRSLGLLLCK